MASFKFIDNDVLIDGVSTGEVATTLQAAGLPEFQIGEILGYWYVGATGNTKPVPFDFATVVQGGDPNCEVTYTREFEHVDWVDGEDRVQASATPEELGFNARFHAIENEFDAIGAQFTSLGACAQEIRADLVGVVKELESRLTKIANQIFELGQETPPTKPGGAAVGGLGILGTVKVGEKDAFITNYGNEFKLVEFEGKTLGSGEGRTFQPSSPVRFDPGSIRPHEVIEIVAGMEDVISTPVIRELVEAGTTVGELRGVGEGVTLPGGMSLSSVIAAMPADTELNGVSGAVEAITAHIASTLPAEAVRDTTTEVITDDNLRSGNVATVRDAGGAGVGMSATTLTLLRGADVDATIGALAGASTNELAGRVREHGIDVSTGELREAVARARLALALRRL